MNDVMLSVQALKKYFPVTRGVIFRKTIAHVRSVDGINFEIKRGKTLGLVGESGSGKTTTGRMILRLIDPTSGTIIFDGTDITKLGKKDMKPIRRKMGIIYQDPFSSLNPRMNVGQIIAGPLRSHGFGDGSSRLERSKQLLVSVGLQPEDAYRYPHQFSGGQRQRIAIARALALSPELIVADEPVSALDVSVQAKIINLMMDIQKKYGLAYLFISHDLSVIKQISDDIAVMYLGKIVEKGSASEVYTTPRHPYTQALMTAVPIPRPDIMRSRKRTTLKGEMPSPLNPPEGCRFNTRCPYVQNKCRESEPELLSAGENQYVACHFWAEIAEKQVT